MRTRRAIAVAAMAMTLIAGVAHANGIQDVTGLTATGQAAGIRTDRQDPTVIIGNIIGGLSGILGTVFVVLLVYGGFQWMTAQGNEEKIKKAKGTITSAVIGLLIIFSAYVITQAVVNVLFTSLEEAPAPAPGP